jgi:hypothetical protein
VVRKRLAGLVIAGGLAAAASARAQDGPFSADSFQGLADIRLTAASGERSWLDRGFGKTSASGDEFEAKLSEVAVEWKPRFNFALSGVVTAHLQPDVDPALDLSEAYLKLQLPTAAGRVSARAGVFWPPISLEHDGVAWTTPHTLTASAINSWVGEEVKVAGLEATFRREFAGHELSATAAVFGWNDTSGTLLSFRGWALHGVKAGPNTAFPLPPLSAFMRTKQAPVTDPFYELDLKAGYYGRLEWRPPAPVVIDALYYDNVGDRVAVEAKQWAWETRFLNVGARWEPVEGTRILAQALNGETLMGFRMPGGIWVDMGFASAYLMAQRDVGEHTLSARIDWFDTRDRTFSVADNNDEEGWALTGAWRHHLSDRANLIVEALHITSKRPSRVLAGEAPKQDQTVLQTALRLSF